MVKKLLAVVLMLMLGTTILLADDASGKFKKWDNTSFLVTGFSSKDRCVSLVNLRRGSRSASSARLLEVRTSVVRFGIEAARLGWI